MDDARYEYKGKSWRPCPTKSDSNSFFHSAFGTRDGEGEEYLDRDAQFRRMRWATFLTYFASKSMPPRLAEVLGKCFSTDDKHKHASVGDEENFRKYISGIFASERNVTREEIPVLATLDNVQIVVLSSTRPDPVVIVAPNPDLLGNYQNVEKAKEEVVLCQDGDTFSKMELVNEVCTPKPDKNVVYNKKAKENLIRSENNSHKYKKGGSAGSKGVQYQVNLLTMVLLNAFRNLREWKLSTENEDAGKFDDIVLEETEGAIFIQSKHKEKKGKRITLDELTSTNSKNDDFSLPKYFLSYLQIKARFKIQNVILCTNADVHERVLKSLEKHEACSKSILHFYEDYSFYTLKDEMLISLKETIQIYYQQNFKNKGIEESEINDENLKGFQQHLQLYFNYPSLNRMETIIDKSLSLIRCCTSSRGKIVSSEMYLNMKEWFQQEEGTYLTQIHAKAMFSEIWREKYCHELDKYDVSFYTDDLNFQPPTQIFHVVANGPYLLQVLKIYHAIKGDKTRTLFVNLDDDIDIQKQAVDAFRLKKYSTLIITWPQNVKEFGANNECGELKGILEKGTYKKIIVVAEDNDRFVQRIGWDRDVVHVSEPVTFEDLHSLSQEGLLERKNIVFQGEKVSLEEMLKMEDYRRALNTEILEKLVRGEQVTVGLQPSKLDENITRYYISRKLKRTLDKRPDEKWNNGEKKENFLDEQREKVSGKEFTMQYGEVGYRDEMKQEEILSEANIYDVKEKVVIISDSAGSGKSTVLAKLALIIKENNPHLWVIRIELNDYTKFLRDSLRNGKKTINITELLNSEKATKLKNHLEEFLFSSDQKVVLLLDGVDEISPDYTGLVLGLLRQCQEESNVIKIFITTRPHMMKELEQVAKVKPFMLQPFKEEDQILFLEDYWENGLQLKDDVSKEKCRRYVEALLRKWKNLDNNEGHPFTTVPLQLRMMAEIFQQNAGSIDSADWKGCKEYVMGNEVQPNLSERMNIADLYRMFVEKKQHIFADKGNPSGNPLASSSITETFDKCLDYHRSLALEVILGKEKLHLFSRYKPFDKDIETQLLKIGIVQKTNEEMHFIHRTFADYFVAECLFSELQQNLTLEFQKFLIDTIFVHPQYNVTHIFLDSLLRKSENYLSPDIFREYQSLRQESSMEFYKLQSQLLHLLAEGECLATVGLILKCIDFKAVRGKEINILNFYRNNFYEDVHKNIFGNTLNLLQNLTKEAGVNIKDEWGRTPLHCAAEKGHLEMAKLLIEGGADINSTNNLGNTPLHLTASGDHLKTIKFLLGSGSDHGIKNNDGFTALHTATFCGHLEIVKSLKEHGSDINVVSNEGSTLLYIASIGGHLDIIKYLFELGVDPHIRNDDGFTTLQRATYYGHLEILKFLKEHDYDFNVVSNDGSTLLHLASVGGHLDIIKYLFELDVDPHIRNNHCLTALQMATYFGYLKIVKFLKEHGSDINVVTNDGSTLLHLASERGHLDIIKYVLELDVDLHIRKNNGCTALQMATYNGHLEIVKFLKEHGSDINVVSNDGNTLLQLASAGGHLDIIKYLFELDVDPHIRDNDGLTALHTATYYGHLEIVKFLKEHGSDINVVSNDGSTLLHIASIGGHLDIIKYLFELDIGPHIRDNVGLTALHMATYYGHLEIVKFLKEHGSDINVVSNDGNTLLQLASVGGHLDIIKYLFELDIGPHIRDSDGLTALHTATYYGHLEIVKFLKEHGSDINVLSNDGSTLLHIASAGGHLDIIKYVLELDVDPNIRKNNGFTALHTATYNGHLEIVKFLKEHGSDINVVTNDGSTLLHLASERGHLDIIKYVLELDVDLHIRKNNGCTALQMATYNGHLEIVKFLKEHGSDINVVSNDGNTLLQLASAGGHLDIIKYLFELDVDPHIRDNDGLTALHTATYNGHLEIVKFLKEHGSDINVITNDGSTLLHIASVGGHLDTIQYLLEIGVNFNVTNRNGFAVLQSTTQCGHLKTIKFLVEYGLDINILNNNGYTLLHLACANGRLDTTKYLLELGMDPNIRDQHGFAAFHLVDGEDQSKIAKSFIDYGLDVDIKSTDGFTLLHLTSADGRLEMVKFLLENGADLWVRDNDGFTPLHLAAAWGQLGAVKLLVEHGLGYNATTNDGRTPLHLASEEGHPDIVEYFLELGVDCNVRDYTGRTALHLAVLAEHLDVVKLLVEHGGDLKVEDNGGHTALHLADDIDDSDTIDFLMEMETHSNIRE